jgi:proteasome lid subunit RPN8/RPN11
VQVEKLELTQAQIDLIIAQARAEAPIEACGLLGGKDGRVLKIYPAVNELASPTRYTLRPQDLLAALEDMEDRGWGIHPLGIYHSHPHGPETPSPTDIAESHYPDSIYVIVAYPDRPQPSLRGFQIANGHYQEVPLEIVLES